MATITTPSNMSAVICEAYGSPEVLKYTEVSTPQIGPKDVLVRVHATTVTAADFRIRSFTIPKSVWLPARLALGVFRPRQSILGAELAGDVVAVGAEVTKWQVGQAVFAATLENFGGYAGYARLSQYGTIAQKPDEITYEEAAAMPVGARTALHYLRKALVGPGQRLLIYGASGSVGTYAIQIGKYIGAEVTAVCSGPNIDMVKSIGATHAIDYTEAGWQERLGSYDVVMAAVDHWSFREAYSYIEEGGYYLNVTDPFASPRDHWRARQAGINLIMGENISKRSEDLEYLACLASKGVIKPFIDREYALQDIVKAHQYVDKGHKRGNVVVRVR